MKTMYTGMVFFPSNIQPSVLLDCDYAEFDSLDDFVSTVLRIADDFRNPEDREPYEADFLQKLQTGNYEIEETIEDDTKYVCLILHTAYNPEYKRA